MIGHSKNSKVLISLVSEFITLTGDFYDIRNFSIAFPNTRNSLCKKIHHFVIHGYSTEKSKERRVDEFNDWFTRSLSLKLNSEDATICNHYFLEDADIMNHDNNPDGPATISTEEAYFCSDEYQEFLDKADSDHLNSRPEFYDKIDQFCLKTSPEEELKSFKKLFDNAELRKWFYEIEQISSFYDHITIIFNLATQTIHCDIGLVIKYLFMEARMKPETPISNFSIISLKSEMSQEWVLHGSREGGLSLFDLFVVSELKILGEEAIYELYPDCRKNIKNIQERIKCLKDDKIPFKTQQDEIWNSCILKKIRDFQFLQQQYADLKVDINSITDIQQFKSYDVILSRDLSKIVHLNNKKKAKILKRPVSKIATTPLMLFSNIFQDTMERKKRLKFIHQSFYNCLRKVSWVNTILLDNGDDFVERMICYEDFTVVLTDDRIPYTEDLISDKLIYPRILEHRRLQLEMLGYGNLPWIYGEPFYLRLSLFKDFKGRKRCKEKYEEFFEIIQKEMDCLLKYSDDS